MAAAGAGGINRALALVVALLVGLASYGTCLEHSAIGRVRLQDSRRVCVHGDEPVLRVTPRRALYGTCVPEGGGRSRWVKIVLESLEPGHHYSVRFSYVARGERVIEMMLETLLSNGTSIYATDEDIDVKVILNQSRRGLVDAGGVWNRHIRNSQALVPPPLDPEEAADDKRELLDTRFKFLNPVDDLKHLRVEAVYLHIRLGLQHYVPEAFGTQPMAPARKGEGEEPDHDAAHPHFFEFDVLLADRAVAKISVSLLPIVMVTVTFFMLANLYVVSRWRRFVRRTADPVNPHYPYV